MLDRRSAEIATHLPTCARCTERVAVLSAEREAFTLRARPAAFVDAVFARKQKRTWRWPWLALALATCALIFMLRPRAIETGDGYKAGPPDALLYVKHESTVAAYAPTKRCVAGDVVQVVVLSAKPIYVAVVDVEAGGKTSVLYNADTPTKAGRASLPRSFELDDWRGGETFVVLFSDEPIADPTASEARGDGKRYPIQR